MTKEDVIFGMSVALYGVLFMVSVWLWVGVLAKLGDCA